MTRGKGVDVVGGRLGAWGEEDCGMEKMVLLLGEDWVGGDDWLGLGVRGEVRAR